jgi:hypothetical protein
MVVNYSETLYQLLLGETEGNHGKPVRVTGLRVDFRTRDFPNMEQEC